MRRIVDIAGYIPISLLIFYIIAFLPVVVESDFYFHNFNLLAKIDNVLTLTSILLFCFAGYKNWNIFQVKTFVTVLLLNILTQASFSLNIMNVYYEIYQGFILGYFLSLALIIAEPQT